MSQLRVPAVFMRGGTSKALFLKERDLEGYPPALRERIILAALGSPDPFGYQLDGLGGATSSTSKVAVIGSAADDDEVDVNFAFGQVGIKEPQVAFLGQCGNISAAVGPFAIDEGLVPAQDAVTRVRIRSVNTGQRYIAHVPTLDGRAAVVGDYAIDGVPGTGACIKLEYLDPGGTLGRGVLPTGRPTEVITLAGGQEVPCSLVDASNPVVFVPAGAVGVPATATPAELNADAGALARLEEIRAQAAVRMGMARDPEEATRRVQAIPKVAVVAPPATYVNTRGQEVGADRMDLVARMLSMGQAHRAFPLTGAMCLTAAANIPGTVVHEVIRRPPLEEGQVHLGHAAGVLAVGVEVEERPGGWHVSRIITYRTARRLMDGHVYVPRPALEGGG